MKGMSCPLIVRIWVPQSAPMAIQHRTESERLLQGSTEGDPVIEGLRGFAALLVMATHYVPMLRPELGLWGFASTGVDLFFVLSGYVFAPYLFGKSLPLVAHLIRRFFRLYPLYLVALLLYVLLRLPAASAWDHFAAHLFMAHTLSSLEEAYFYNAAFWSLPPEVEYYLLLPLLAWVATRNPVSSLREQRGNPGLDRSVAIAMTKPVPWSLFVCILLLAVAMHLLLVASASPNEGITVRAIATIHLPGLLIEFMWGSLAYALLQRVATLGARLLRLTLGLVVLAGMLVLFASYIAPVHGVAGTAPPWVSGNIGLGAAFGYALLVSALASATRQTTGQAARWFTPWFVRMGQLSYGVYLFHNAAPQILRRILPTAAGVAAVLLCVAITLALAWAAHHAIERPLRNYGRRLSQVFKK